MTLITKHPKTFVASLLALAVLLSHPSFAQDDDDVRQSVARIAFLSGSASFNRGDDPDSWEDAVVNFPMTVGDRLYTARDGRMELQAEGVRIFLGPESELAALDLRDDIRQLSLTIGTASFRINRLSEGEVFEVDTPNVSLTFQRPGYYRVDVDRDGNTFASIFKGSAVAVAAGGEVDLQADDAIQVDGLDEPRYDIVALPRSDAWDRWVDERSRRLREGISVRYASSDIVGLDDLDREGDWRQIPDYGWVWSPPVTVTGWAPYRNGRWTWQDPWGWTWISYDPWGWAPYHYGSWVSWQDRWFWVPVPRAAQAVRYSPARVVFTGAGPGWSGSASSGGANFVGWFPIGPRDAFIPWWGRRTAGSVNNVRYVNQTHVTVVNRDAFIGGRMVDREVVRDQRVIHQMVTAPVLHGPLPILPVPGSVRFSVRTEPGSAARPPRAVEGRAVVTRLVPPPAPPTFQAKLGLITSNGGMPVGRVSAEKLAVEVRRQPRPVVNYRPAVPEGGKVLLAPKRELVETRPVRAAAPPDGRKVTTGERPLPATRQKETPPPMGRADILKPDGGPVRNPDRPIDRGQPERRDPAPRPEARPELKPEPKAEPKPEPRPADRSFDRPVDRGQPERRDPKARPEVKPEMKPDAKPDVRPETKPDVKPVQRSVDRPVEQGQPERRDHQTRPEVKPPDRPPVAAPPQPRVEQKPPPAVRVEQAPPAPRVEKPKPAPKVEKAPPAKPDEVKKDKKDR